ncbi:MAG: type II secretion system protein GspG [Myxococcota bacterium]
MESVVTPVVERRGSRRRRRGMSLVEVMVVIAIILTLMSVIAIGVWGIFADSRVDTTRLTMTKVNERLEIYTLRKKKPPSTTEGLAAAFGNEQIPKDSWNNEFQYVSPGPGGEAYDLVSLGADGQEGGTGNDADLKWSELKNQ